MKRIIISTIVLVLAIVGFGLYYYEGSLPVNKNDAEPVQFVVTKGATVNAIINDLQDEGLIRNRVVFLIIVKRLGIENQIQAGLFRLNPAMSAEEVARALTQGSDDIWVTIIEGLRKEEIAEILAEEVGISETEFNNKAEEGYLFPDTYLIPRTADVDQILQIFENNFNAKFDDSLRAQAAARGWTVDDVLMIASLVEREANTDRYMQEVASIIVKRAENDWPLEIDATTQYALGYDPVSKSWWKKSLTREDLNLNSPYNTRKFPGFPPGPIASPGLTAIEAVIQSDPSTPYWFYISNKDGSKMYFSKTLEEHNENISQHLR